MLLSEGQMSDYKGAALMIEALPRATELLGDKGYRFMVTHKGLLPEKANGPEHCCGPSTSRASVHPAQLAEILNRRAGFQRLSCRACCRSWLRTKPSDPR